MTVNEYAYLCVFLYPHYMSAVYEEHSKLARARGLPGGAEEILKNIEEKVAGRGRFLSTKAFRILLDECLSNLYIHATSVEDLKRTVDERKEDEQAEEAQKKQKAQMKYNDRGAPDLKQHEMNAFNFSEITYVEDMKKQMNFSYMQSLALCAAYITGMNKESTDMKIFERSNKSKKGGNTGAGANKEGKSMVGKSKRFTLERYAAVLDYLISTQAEEAQENKMYGHSLEYYATINSLAGEGLLKKYVMKRSLVGEASSSGAAGAGEDLTSVSFKCNFDSNFINEVARKIGFELKEYADVENEREE